MIECIKYCEGYKYQLVEDYSILLPFAPPTLVDTEYIDFDAEGKLTIKEGYAWDGCSGVAIDCPSNMRGGLIHDALYQLMRGGYLPESRKDDADKMLRDVCLADGMLHIRAEGYYEAVHLFAAQYAKKQERKVLTAP